MQVPPGTRLRATNNGGGWGDPMERDIAAIAWDVRQGYVTREAAERDYGAVFNADGSIDAAAIEERRRRQRRA